MRHWQTLGRTQHEAHGSSSCARREAAAHHLRMVGQSCGAVSSTCTATAWKRARRSAILGTRRGRSMSALSSVRACSHASTRPLRNVPSTCAPNPARLSCFITCSSVSRSMKRSVLSPKRRTTAWLGASAAPVVVPLAVVSPAEGCTTRKRRLVMPPPMGDTCEAARGRRVRRAGPPRRRVHLVVLRHELSRSGCRNRCTAEATGFAEVAVTVAMQP